MSKKGDRARQLLREGKSYREVAAESGLLYGSISYHAKALGLGSPSCPSYDWKSVQNYYDEGHTRLECIDKFGFCKSAWDGAIKRKNLVVGDYRIPLDELLVKNSNKNSSYLKRRVLAGGILSVSCYACGMTDIWNGKPITLWLDHENGDGNDWRRENLRMVCPNCDSQSPTYAGRNIALKKKNIGK